MRKLTIMLLGCVFSLAVSAQQHKSVSVLGDSYSTFEGYMTPATNELWYNAHPRSGTDVNDVSQTWWHKFIKENGYRLCVNNSYSGSTIGYYGYSGNDYSERSFITRMNNLGCPDIVFIFGGTNDSWAGAPVGEYKYKDLRKDDFFAYRPALAYLLKSMTDRYVNTEIYFLINDGLRDDITSSTIEICKYYGVKYILLHDIDKQSGHPTIKGHAEIASQIKEALSGGN